MSVNFKQASGKKVVSRKLEGLAFWKPRSIAWVFGMLLLVLLGRLTWLQLIAPDVLIHESERRSVRIQALQPSRATITDRHGAALAVSIPVVGIVVNPTRLFQHGLDNIPATHWHALSNALDLTPRALTQLIQHHKKQQFLYLLRQADPALGQYIQTLNIPGLTLRSETRRFYPTGEIAAQLIGVTDIDGNGIDGIEKAFNKELTGTPGERVVVKNRSGRVIEDRQQTLQNEPHTLALAIDERLQLASYRALTKTVKQHRATSGSLVIIDITTGEILSMANSPSFNPNNRVTLSPGVLRNRAISDCFEPGSTIKPFVILKALEDELITPQSRIDTGNGTLQLDGHTIHDVRNYGTLSVSGILEKSSNVAISKIALTMPIKQLQKFYQDVGLTGPTSLGLIGEQSGFMTTRQKLSTLERATLSFGYGLAVTPLQLGQAYATLGRHGIYCPLSVLSLSKNDLSTLPLREKRIISRKSCQVVLEMLENVSNSVNTGAQAAVPGYRVAVKTGTSRKAVPGGYSKHQYISYTAGIAPVSAPRLALVIVIDDPKNGSYYGGKVAAPLFSEVMGNALRLLNIPPDKGTLTEALPHLPQRTTVPPYDTRSE